MSGTDKFKKAIAAFIEREKQADELFAECVNSQPEKTIDGCVNFILKTVRESKIEGWTDDEVYGMAKHFFDEKELKDPGTIRGAHVVVNHQVELTDQEKAEAKKKALADFEAAERERLEQLQAEEQKRQQKRQEARIKAAEAKREKESKMQLDLFG